MYFASFMRFFVPTLCNSLANPLNLLCVCVSARGHNEWLGYCQTKVVTIHQLDSHLLGSDRTKWRSTDGGRRQGRDRRMRSGANDRTREKPSET